MQTKLKDIAKFKKLKDKFVFIGINKLCRKFL